MNKLILIWISISILTLTACYYDVEEDIYPTLACATDNVTYSGTIAPLLQANCLTCHSAAANFGNITLEGYTQVKRYVDNGQLMGAVRHESGFSPMPKNQPRMADCNIEKIARWITDGALNN